MAAETTADQSDSARPFAASASSSLNLKIEDNLNEYTILVVNERNHDEICKDLSNIISTDRIQGFDDVESTLLFIQSISDTNIFAIISGTLAVQHAHELAKIPKIIGIYIYCMNKDRYAKLLKEIPKIRCSLSNITQLFVRLHADIKQLSGRWPIGEKSYQATGKMTSEWYHLFLLIISHRPKCLGASYREMFEECRAYYKNNPSMLNRIDKAAQNYRPADAVYLYTQDNFIYRITNHALRTQNMEVIKKFSPFLTDLHSQLHDHHRNYYYRSKERSIHAVYRGQYMHLDEIENLSTICKSRNPIVKLTTFSSTSLDPLVALDLIHPLPDRIPCLFEILITDDYNATQNHISSYQQVFANISSLSSMPYEQEVLFSLLSHFRVKYVGEPIIRPDYPWVPIVLELTRDEIGNVKEKATISHYDIVEHLENETNPQYYADLLHLLEVNVTDESQFDKKNWRRWWTNLAKQWGGHRGGEQPLILRLYDCFTEEKDWLRKAVEMHKEILHSYVVVDSDTSSFMPLYDDFKGLQPFPTKAIAFYENYLKQICTTNTTDVIKCLKLAGSIYKRIHDRDRSLECYEKAIQLDLHDMYKMSGEIQNQIKELRKPSKSSKMENTEHAAAIRNINKDFQQMYEAQEEQWSSFWNIVHRTSGINHSKETNLRELGEYLHKREQWYNASDFKIVFHLSNENTQDFTIHDYLLHYFSAVRRHVSSSVLTDDMIKNRSLYLWRYERYVQERALLQQLSKFFKPFYNKLSSILSLILPQLNRLIEKLNLLITFCTAYICIEQGTGHVNVKNIPSIDTRREKLKQLVFFDLHDRNLRRDLEALEERPLKSFPPICMSSAEFDFLDTF